jgi:hypothetical protein
MAQLPTFNESEMLIGVAGDWHGNTNWAVSALDLFARFNIRTILQLGDFGVWPGEGGARYLGALRRTLEKNDQTLYVTLGNHEDYTQVAAVPVDEENGLQWIRHNIALFPRPFRFEIKLTTFLSLGGAPSIDRHHRTPYRSWWPEEVITEKMVEEALAGGHANVMLTHDAPNGGTRTVEQILSCGNGWPKDALAYAAEGRELLDKAVYGVKPDMLLHGHYHVKDSGYLRYDNSSRGEIHSLTLDGEVGNVAVLHIDEDFIFDWIEK